MEPLARILADPDYQSLSDEDKAFIRLEYAQKIAERKAKSGPVTKAIDTALDFAGGVAKRLAPFPGAIAAFGEPESPEGQRARNDLGVLVNPIPTGISQGFQDLSGALSQYVSPEAGKLPEQLIGGTIGMPTASLQAGTAGLRNLSRYGPNVRGTSGGFETARDVTPSLPQRPQVAALPSPEPTAPRAMPPPITPQLESPAQGSARFFIEQAAREQALRQQQAVVEKALLQSDRGAQLLRGQLAQQEAIGQAQAPIVPPEIPPARAEAIAKGKKRAAAKKPPVITPAPAITEPTPVTAAAGPVPGIPEPPVLTVLTAKAAIEKLDKAPLESEGKGGFDTGAETRFRERFAKPLARALEKTPWRTVKDYSQSTVPFNRTQRGDSSVLSAMKVLGDNVEQAYLEDGTPVYALRGTPRPAEVYSPDEWTAKFEPAPEPPVLTAPEVVDKIESQQDPKHFDKPAIEEAVTSAGDTYVKTTADPNDLTIREGVKPGQGVPDKGAVVVGEGGEVIDGNHRVADAQEKGEPITAYVPAPVEQPVVTAEEPPELTP